MKSLYNIDTPSRITYRKTYHPSLREKFWSFVDIKGKEECWNWVYYKNYRGYGIFKAMGKSFLAHRTSYEFCVGKIPEGMFICHHCDNPACVNPNHLFLGNHRDNMQDMAKKGRARTSPKPKGDNSPYVKILDKDVFEIRKMYKTGKYTYFDLADKFGVSFQLIGKIVKNRYR